MCWVSNQGSPLRVKSVSERLTWRDFPPAATQNSERVCIVLASFSPELPALNPQIWLHFGNIVISIAELSNIIALLVPIAPPFGCSLLDECLDSFFGVGMQHVLHHDLTRESVCIGNRHVELLVEGLFSKFDCDR